MILRDLIRKDTPCIEGIYFALEHGILDWELEDCWDLVKRENPVFLSWLLKHAPNVAEYKSKAFDIMDGLGVWRIGNEWMMKDRETAEKAFGWIENPFRRVE